MEKDITKLIAILKNGGIGIFPTDTAFAIGCRMDDVKAIERLFAIKGRANTKAMPVLVDSIEVAQKYLQPIPEEIIEKLLNKYWPGALTVILPCLTDKVPALVRGDGDTLGVRMPNHQAALELIRGIGVPLIGTSANFAGGLTSVKTEQLDKELIQLVDFVLPGECSAGKSSTVIDVSVKPWKIVREGAVNLY